MSINIDPQVFAQHLDEIIKILLHVIVNADVTKFDDDLKVKMKNLISKLSSDPQSKSSLEKQSATLDQSAIAKFLA